MDPQVLYEHRLRRYRIANRNGRPDRVPVRPFAAEFTARHAGYTNQQVVQNYELLFDAVLRSAQDYGWDAVPSNMIWNWAGVAEMTGWKPYIFPGLELPPSAVVQYAEPSEGDAYMKADEYDRLIEDPTAFLFEVWLPRFSKHVRPPGEEVTFRHNMALLNGGMTLMDYNSANAKHAQRLIDETGTVPAIAGMLKAPLDVISDKMRGFVGLTVDLMERPEKVLEACEALMPHLYHFASITADPEQNAPIPIWMHRGCVPFISPSHFDEIYWPTLKPIVENLWSEGKQVLFYAEGNWMAHLDAFAELPERSIIFHVDQGDVFRAHDRLGGRFCLSGGIPNQLLSFGSTEDVRDRCREVIEKVAGDGGYILDASAIIQDDARPENMKAMVEAAHDFGTYGSSMVEEPSTSWTGEPPSIEDRSLRKPGTCIPWEEQSKAYSAIRGDEALAREMWEAHDSWGYQFIWQTFLW